MGKKKTSVRKTSVRNTHRAEKGTGLRKRQGSEREIGKGEKQKKTERMG
jgi:hypothetical protein